MQRPHRFPQGVNNRPKQLSTCVAGVIKSSVHVISFNSKHSLEIISENPHPTEGKTEAHSCQGAHTELWGLRRRPRTSAWCEHYL